MSGVIGYVLDYHVSTTLNKDDSMDDLDSKDHFSKGSEGYATYRPTYPLDLVNNLADL